MNSLTKIVKSIAVVDDRAPQKPVLPLSDLPFARPAVLKKHIIDGGGPLSRIHQPLTVDSQRDELNRLLLEIKEAKETLRDLGVQVEEARAVDTAAIEKEAARQEERDEAREKAGEILAQANAQADDILKGAKAEAIQITEQARNNGYLEGFSKGYEEATQEFIRENNQRALNIAELLDALSDYKEELLRSHEENLVGLSVAIAKKIMGQTLEINPAAVAEMLHEIVERGSREEYVKIILAPDLAPIQAKASQKVRAALEALAENVTVITDPELPEGGAMVETPKGITDAGIPTQIDNITNAIFSE